MGVEVNPFQPPETSPRTVVAKQVQRNCCPVCDTLQQRRWRYLLPGARCGHCGIKLGIVGPIWPALVIGFGAIVAVFASYYWLQQNPQNLDLIGNQIYFLSVFFFIEFVVACLSTAKFGRLVPIYHWFPASKLKTIELREAYQNEVVSQ